MEVRELFGPVPQLTLILGNIKILAANPGETGVGDMVIGVRLIARLAKSIFALSHKPARRIH